MNGLPPAFAAGSSTRAAQWVRLGVDLVTGTYAFAAVVGLAGLPVQRGDWIGVLTLHLALGFAGWRLRAAPDRRGWLTELCLLLAAAAGLGLLPGLPLSWAAAFATAFLGRVLAVLLEGVARLGSGGREPEAADQARVLTLFILSAGSVLAYLSPHVVGPKDARWYANLVMDFLPRLRAGDFPVFSGESVYAFNGSVLSVRTAPGHVHLVALADGLTGRVLRPVAVQHLALIGCFVGGVLGLYAALARLRPHARWLAWIMAVIYATSPALTTPLIEHDMYMTVTAMPALVFVLYATARAMEAGALRHYAWVGIGCAAAWYAHPPLGFLITLGAGSLLAMQAAGEGLTSRWVAGCALGGVLFAVLFLPLLYSVSELPPVNVFDPVPNLVLPLAGLVLLGGGLVRLSRTGQPASLVPLAAAFLLLREFKPSLGPFCWMGVALFGAMVVADHLRPYLGVRVRPEPWLAAAAFAAAAAAAAWFPESSLPVRTIVADVVGKSLSSWREFLSRVERGSDSQPHAVWWVALACGLVLVWRTPSRFARGALVVGLMTVASILPVPLVKGFIWGNTTVEIWDLLVNGEWLRLWPFSVPPVLFAVHVMVADLPPGSRGARVVLVAGCLLLPWTVIQHIGHMRTLQSPTAAQSERFFRPENVILQSYSWDHLRRPSYFAGGSIDPRLEFRLWRQGPGRVALLDPDLIARGLEAAAGASVLALQASQDPTYPQWIYLAPKVELLPGEHKLLRFDFKGRQPRGWLIIRGQDILREYVLPSAGMERSFGAGRLNTRTISIENTGAAPELLEIVLKREGPGATDPVRPEEIPAVTVARFDPTLAPVAVRSLAPLIFRVNAPERGMLEVFRSAYPGYRVAVNGRSVPYISSRDGLIAFEVPAGESEVVVRFRGTWQLRDLYWFGLLAWSAVTFALVFTLGRAALAPR